jgi:hypothetical protein
MMDQNIALHRRCLHKVCSNFVPIIAGLLLHFRSLTVETRVLTGNEPGTDETGYVLRNGGLVRFSGSVRRLLNWNVAKAGLRRAAFRQSASC